MKKINKLSFILFLMILFSKTTIQAQGLATNKLGSIFPEDIKWSSFPAFPKSAGLSVLIGDPTKAGLYTVRVKVPAGLKLEPHIHPEDRIYTVISGVFYIGIGNKFEDSKLKAYPPGSVLVLPANTPHFHWAKSGDYITQVTAIGPLGISYLDPKDDLRNKKD